MGRVTKERGKTTHKGQGGAHKAKGTWMGRVTKEREPGRPTHPNDEEEGRGREHDAGCLGRRVVRGHARLDEVKRLAQQPGNHRALPSG